MIPQELRDLPQWVVAGNNKVPLNPRTLHAASVTDSRSWATFEEARAVALENELNIGFVFTKDDPYVGIDLDWPESEEQRERHAKILKTIETYTELSKSGTGVHLIGRGVIPHALKRDKVEVYDRERYFIMTGRIVLDRTVITDISDFVQRMVKEMSAKQVQGIEHSEPEREGDATVVERCVKSANGQKFLPLWQGRWRDAGYSSQSEADYALVNMLAFMTPNNEQTKRLFRQSGLGNREKAYREDYLDRMIGRIRAEQHPPVDFSNFTPPTPKVMADEPLEVGVVRTGVDYPRGLVGEMGEYIYQTATRPVQEIALAGALGLMAGLTGRCYNISNTGLNLYIMLIAGTAIGKEGAGQGVRRLVKSVTPKLPSILRYLGPTEYASGQALVKQLKDTPCFVSVMSEFGHTIKRVSAPNAIGADIMWRKLLLDLFNKSGKDDVLGSMVYSDTGKNTPTVNSPAFTLLTESSAASMFEGLDEQAIEIGLIPRFLLIECGNKRPPTNPNAFGDVPGPLSEKLEALAHRCLSMEANNSHQNVKMSTKGYKLLQEFDREVDDHINKHNDDAIRQIWSRAHLKALRLAALVTVGLDMDNPVVQAEEARWAIGLVRADAESMLRRFGEGVGGGDPVQLAKLRTAVLAALENGPRKMSESGVVTHRQLSQRVYPLACYRQDRRGAGNALRFAIQALVDNGELIVVSPHQMKENFGTTAKGYAVTKNFEV